MEEEEKEENDIESEPQEIEEEHESRNGILKDHNEDSTEEKKTNIEVKVLISKYMSLIDILVKFLESLMFF